MLADVQQIVTFSTDPFKGNPAFVISHNRKIADTTMQKLAAQLNEPVLTSLRTSQGNCKSVGFHTPAGRHGGAGHAMMAAAHVALEGQAAHEATLMLSDGSTCTVFRHGEHIAVPWPVMNARVIDRRENIGLALGSTPDETFEAPFAYVGVYREGKQIESLVPDMKALSHLDRGAVIATAPGDQSDFVLRVFAPRLGLPEDPVCGTAHRILVPYWIDRLVRATLHSRQLSPRGGELWCWVSGDRVIISGHSRTFLKGVVDIPVS